MGQLVHNGNAEATPDAVEGASEMPSRKVRKALGARRLSEICDLNDTACRKWDRRMSKGGTGGLVPARYQQRILNEIDRLGLPLTARDLIAEPIP